MHTLVITYAVLLLLLLLNLRLYDFIHTCQLCLKKVQRVWNSPSWFSESQICLYFFGRFVVTQPKSDARGGDQ